MKTINIKCHLTRRNLILVKCIQGNIDVPSVETQSMLKVSSVLQEKFQYKSCNRHGHFTSLCYKKKIVSFKSRTSKAHQLQAGQIYMHEDSLCSQSGDLTSSNESFCLQVKIQCTQASSKIPTPHHLITNLTYRLKLHHKRNQYLRAR